MLSRRPGLYVQGGDAELGKSCQMIPCTEATLLHIDRTWVARGILDIAHYQ